MIKKLFLLFIIPSTTYGAITCTPNLEDIYSSPTPITSRTISANIGTPSNGLLIVTSGVRTGGTITGITWNGTSMRLGNHTTNSGSGNVASVWGLENPDTGTHDVVVSFSGNTTQAYSTVMVCEGALQTSSVVDQSTGTFSTTGTPTVDITPSEDGELIVGHLTTEFNAPPTVGTDFTIIFSEDGGAYSYSSEYYIQSTAATHAVDWASGTESWVVAAASFRQAAAGGGGGGNPATKRQIIIVQ